MINHPLCRVEQGVFCYGYVVTMALLRKEFTSLRMPTFFIFNALRGTRSMVHCDRIQVP